MKEAPLRRFASSVPQNGAWGSSVSNLRRQVWSRSPQPLIFAGGRTLWPGVAGSMAALDSVLPPG